MLFIIFLNNGFDDNIFNFFSQFLHEKSKFILQWWSILMIDKVFRELNLFNILVCFYSIFFFNLEFWNYIRIDIYLFTYRFCSISAIFIVNCVHENTFYASIT